MAELRKLDDHAPAGAIKCWPAQPVHGAVGRGGGRVSRTGIASIRSSITWVRGNRDRLGLAGASDVRRFIERDFTFYARWYKEIHTASESWTPGLESVFRNDLNALARSGRSIPSRPWRRYEDRGTSPAEGADRGRLHRVPGRAACLAWLEPQLRDDVRQGSRS